MPPFIRQVDVIQVQLIPADLAQQTVEGAVFQPHPHLIIDFPQNSFLILLIEDNELARILKTMDVFPENPDAKTMVGRDQTGVIPLLQQGNAPLLHLSGCLIGEGDAENIRRIDSQIFHDKRIAMCERLGLTRTGHATNYTYPSVILTVSTAFHSIPSKSNLPP